MSTPGVNNKSAPASVQTDAGTAAGSSGQFQGSPASIVGSDSRDARPDSDAATQISAWKLGTKGAATNPILKSLKIYADAARKQALSQSSNSAAGSRNKGAGSKFKAAKNSLLSAFRGSRPAATGKQERLCAISENSRVILSDPEASILIRQAATVDQGTDVIPRARSLLQKTGNREEITSYFDQSLQNRREGGTQKRHFRNISTALTSAGCIADTENAGPRIMQAAHPKMDGQQQARFAERIELGALILNRLQDARYVPERQELQDLFERSDFNSFGDANSERNPYLLLAGRKDFSDNDEKHIRGALLDALQLVEDSAQLLTSSVLGEESSVDPEQLIEQAGRCGIRISTHRETSLASEVQTETTFQVAENPPAAGKKLETTV